MKNLGRGTRGIRVKRCFVTSAVSLISSEARSACCRRSNRLLEHNGLSGRLAIADSVGACWAISHYQSHSRCEHDSPENGWIAPPGQSRQVIESLPVEALRIWPDTVATLSRLGIETIGQLLRLPRGGLATRLGHPLVKRIEQAIAEVDEPIGVYRAPPEHSATATLEYSTSDQKILADRIERLVEKVRAGLATCQRGAQRLVCRLDLSAHPPLTFEIGLFAPTIDGDHLSGLLVNRLESMKLPSCVERITISVTLSGPLRTAQVSLFATEMGDENGSTNGMSGSSLSRFVDSLSNRLGRDAVVSVTLEKDPLPENAFSVLPLTGNRFASAKSVSSSSVRLRLPEKSSAKSPRSSDQNCWPKHLDCSHAAAYEPSPSDAMRRPLSLLVDPIPIAVAFEEDLFLRQVPSPRLPSRIRLDGSTHRIVDHWGPERIETGWWKGPCIRRDYYRIETDQGRWWWIFRNLVSETQASDTKACYCWMLHGKFA